MKAYSIYIDYRGSRKFKNKKMEYIKNLYDEFREFKLEESNHSVDYISFIGDAVLLVIRSGEIQGNFLDILKEIEEQIEKIEKSTGQILGVGISYGKVLKISDHTGPEIVSEATDYASIASNLSMKNNDWRFTLPLKTKFDPALCENKSLKDFLEKKDDITKKISSSKKNFYFNLN